MNASYIRPRIILFAFLFLYIVTIDFKFIMQIKLSKQIKSKYLLTEDQKSSNNAE